MSVTAKALVETVQLPAVETTQYTAPVGIRTIIDKCTMTNVTGGPIVVRICLVPALAVASGANAIAYNKTIQSNETYPFPEIVGHILAPGDFVSTLTGAAASVNFRMSGREVSA